MEEMWLVMEEVLEEPVPKLKLNEGHQEDGGGHEDEEEVCVMEEDLEEPALELKIKKGDKESGGSHEGEEVCHGGSAGGA